MRMKDSNYKDKTKMKRVYKLILEEDKVLEKYWNIRATCPED